MNGGVNLTGADCAELVQFIDQAHDAHEFEGMHALGDLVTVQALCIALNTIRSQLIVGNQWTKQPDESNQS
jgi:hypothetical protein